MWDRSMRTMVCDGFARPCFKALHGKYDSLGEAEEKMRAKKWLVVGGFDYCPKCARDFNKLREEMLTRGYM